MTWLTDSLHVLLPRLVKPLCINLVCKFLQLLDPQKVDLKVLGKTIKLTLWSPPSRVH